ncbi:hypothetical protein CQA66_04395 [Helicobacter aurati]|uniref:Uncharacterized protein n=1 Tax=Helicobacter aurati TaxID=137778 RepID=A0A3D8J6U9_9HELI|nr:hypothetical protein [Helicobacter aurati]RDU72551.1 hypothetical protein CQA66_04395 [Helicobacter aurati]
MRLGKALDILYGTLLNDPYISCFHGMASTVHGGNVRDSHIKQESLQGALFFAVDKCDIAEAVKQGVYGIVFEGKADITDNEIAWINVEDIHASIKRLVRYLIGESESHVMLVSKLELYILKSIAPHLAICDANSLPDSLQFFYTHYKLHSSEELDCKNASAFSHFVFASIESLQEIDIPKIYSYYYKMTFQDTEPDVITIRKNNDTIFKLFSFNLLESKIIYRGLSYVLGIPFIFLPFVKSVLALLEWTLLHECESPGRNVSHAPTLFSQDSNISKLCSYNLKSLQHFELFEIVRHRHLSCNSSAYKTLIFCKNPEVLALSRWGVQDFYFSKEAMQIMQKVLPRIHEPSVDLLLAEYFDLQAAHLRLLSLFPHGHTFGKNRAKSNLNHSKLTFAHYKHLYQILYKAPFDIAIIYGVSKVEFARIESLNKTIINVPKGQQYFFEINDNMQQ